MTVLEFTQERNPIPPFRRQSRQILQSSWFVVVAITIAGGQFGPIEAVAAENSVNLWLTGGKLKKELEQPFSASWKYADLRVIAHDISTDRHIAIVVDRRLDPSAQISFDTKNVSLRTGLDDLAKQAKGNVSLPGNLVYLGPESATRRLRTLIELRKLELQSKESGISDRRRPVLQGSRSFAWNDLETPRRILENIAHPFRLAVTNADQIPHDLWAAATLPDVTLTEALCIVLNQFDLTFRWSDAGESIQLVPIPKLILVERKYRSRLKPDDGINLIHQKFPDLDAKISHSEIVVNGSLEEHEAVSSLLRGDNPLPSAKVEQPAPIRNRLFTLTANLPLIEIMKKLEESDIHFEYNADELNEAGIDLQQMIQLDVKNLPAADFLRSLFGPAQLDFQIDRLTVKLKPKRSKSSQ